MKPHKARCPGRRRFGTAALGIAVVAAFAISGCVGAPPGTVPDSLASFDRTYNAALGAITDQQMNVEVNDRRQGRIVGKLGDDTITATLQPLVDGTIGVSFRLGAESTRGAALLKQVVAAYNTRISATQSLLP